MFRGKPAISNYKLPWQYGFQETEKTQVKVSRRMPLYVGGAANNSLVETAHGYQREIIITFEQRKNNGSNWGLSGVVIPSV